ncbi:MAG: Mur ligase family protein, partial [Candidatus Korarchaeum sp.]|nr:Mur ligase family protein [Candidatus Korarchaeum sp.]
MRVLVVDATHGGLVLSEAFKRRGFDVVCVDVHRTLKDSDHRKYSGEFRIESTLPNPSDLSKYDLIVRPVHFPSSPFEGFENRVITHHDAVRMLISDKIKFPVVEITGSFGKTTAVKCAISILRDHYSILSLTSEGITFTEGGRDDILLGNVSVTPANIIRAVELCPKEPDLAIFEVSLGGTGMADLGIIKNVYDNYPIAMGSSSALAAKLSMVRNRKPGSVILLNYDDPLLKGISHSQYFSIYSKNCEVYVEKYYNIDPYTTEIIINFNKFSTIRGEISSHTRVKSYKGIGSQNLENIVIGVSIAKFFNTSIDELEIPPEVFENKMVLEDPSGPLVVNKSPAMNAKVVYASI